MARIWLDRITIAALIIAGMFLLAQMPEPAASAPDSTIRNSVAVCDPYAPDQCVQPGFGWSYAAVSGGITSSADTTIQAAGAAGIRNYIKSLQIFNAHATVDTEVVVKDGSTTVIWRGYAPATTADGAAVNIIFENALRTTAATALIVAAITSGSQVYINAQGYTAQ